MDANTTQVLVLLITTSGTVLVAYVKMRTPKNKRPVESSPSEEE